MGLAEFVNIGHLAWPPDRHRCAPPVLGSTVLTWSGTHFERYRERGDKPAARNGPPTAFSSSGAVDRRVLRLVGRRQIVERFGALEARGGQAAKAGGGELHVSLERTPRVCRRRFRRGWYVLLDGDLDLVPGAESGASSAALNPVAFSSMLLFLLSESANRLNG